MEAQAGPAGQRGREAGPGQGLKAGWWCLLCLGFRELTPQCVPSLQAGRPARVPDGAVGALKDDPDP